MRRITVAGAKRRVGRVLNRTALRLGAIHPTPAPEPYAAGFFNWNQRRTSRLKADFPAQWRGALAVPRTDEPMVAVVLHVFYLDLVDELLTELAAVPIPFDLIITNATGSPLALNTSGLTHMRDVRVFDIANHGRDILPLVSLVNADVIEPYSLILKIHTKKSAWREHHPDLDGSGDAWRTGLVGQLLGGEQNIKEILGAFASDPGLGLLTGDGSVLGSEFWGGDRAIVTDLLRRLQLAEIEDLRFASGSMYWCRAFILQGLRAVDLSPEDFEAETGQTDATTAHAIERLIGIVTEESGYDTRERSSATVEPVPDGAWEYWSARRPDSPRARVIPFYLPQFHRFDENDSWWGEGFTEWSNVAAGIPLFAGQNQPLLPADLGFYDLTSDDVRERQLDLAREAGIEGFMYYYYWFAGKKLMNSPVESLVASGSETPFCIMWANENFTRRWDGSEENVLIGQDYDKVSAVEFIHDVLPLLRSEHYIRIYDKPVVAVYRITQIPNFVEVVAEWQRVAAQAGLAGLHVVTVDVGEIMQGVTGRPSDYGLDAVLEFAPHNMNWTAQPHGALGVDDRFHGNLMSYARMAEHAERRLREDPIDPSRYPGIMVNFDNTARRQWMPDIWYGSNPYTFRRWLDSTVAAVADREADRRVVFINAWNEWAESAVLEPSRRFGKTFLLAVRDVVR